MTFEDLDCHVLEWARERGILAKSDPKTQCLKMVSEVGELADAVAVGDMMKTIDGIGDVLVTLIILSELLKLDATECLETAYTEIAKREGTMVNGIFVKTGVAND
mgnify:CR=1 FL=1